MIIPKAIFLRHTWLRNRESTENASRNERTLMAGELARVLRAPCNHKAGTVSCFFARSHYPVLASGGEPEVLEALLDEFSSAGYAVSLLRGNDGIRVTLDWRTPPTGLPPPPQPPQA